MLLFGGPRPIDEVEDPIAQYMNKVIRMYDYDQSVIEETRRMLAAAEMLARQAHAGQYRRDGVTPYISHPEAVAAYFPHDPYAAAVAWLHDVVEDTDVTFRDIRDRGFPINVVVALGALTHMDDEPYQDYIERALADPLARRVKFADMLCNLADDPTEAQRLKYTKALAEFLPLLL